MDLGLPVEELKGALASLPFSGYTLEEEKVSRCGIGATLLRVQSEEGHSHRSFTTIRGMIAQSGFSPAVKERAIRAFERLATVEASIHGTSVDHVHFHELGAIDAIVDICGAMWGFERMGIDEVQASAVAVGSGTVKTAHGIMPVPAPATARLLEGVPVSSGETAGELATPTGAVILTTVASRFGPMRDLRISRTGYGAGSREYPGYTNYLRVFLGETGSASVPVDQHKLAILETEIDDMNPEILGGLMDTLLVGGALDVSFVPVHMKKNRPGVLLHVLVKPDWVNETLEAILRGTSTFGVRVIPCDRYCLKRDMRQVETAFGSVAVKVGFWGKDALKASPEYEDCRKLAAAHGVPLYEVFAAANAAVTQMLPLWKGTVS